MATPLFEILRQYTEGYGIDIAMVICLLSSHRRLSEKLGLRNSIEEPRGDLNSKEHHFNSTSVPNGLDCTVAHMSSEGGNDVSTWKPSKQNPSQPS